MWPFDASLVILGTINLIFVMPDGFMLVFCHRETKGAFAAHYGSIYGFLDDRRDGSNINALLCTVLWMLSCFDAFRVEVVEAV